MSDPVDIVEHGVSVKHDQPDEHRKCGACNYSTVNFYSLDPINFESNDPADWGMCSNCFADLLAGEGLVGIDADYVVIDRNRL